MENLSIFSFYDKIVFEEHGIAHLLHCAKDLVDYDIDDPLHWDPTLFNAVKFTTLNSPIAIRQGISQHNAEFLLLRVRRNQKSAAFFSETISAEEKGIYIFIEKNSCIVTSNCVKIAAKLSIDRGISINDFLQKNIFWDIYLDSLTTFYTDSTHTLM